MFHVKHHVRWPRATVKQKQMIGDGMANLSPDRRRPKTTRQSRAPWGRGSLIALAASFAGILVSSFIAPHLEGDDTGALLIFMLAYALIPPIIAAISFAKREPRGFAGTTLAIWIAIPILVAAGEVLSH